MTDTWAAVDRYIADQMVESDSALESALAASTAAGLPDIQVTPAQGKLLHLLARAIGARRILEIGTLGGYSSIWLARALPSDGRLVTLEVNPEHAAVARRNIAGAGLGAVVDVRLGDARDSLQKLAGEHGPRFDFVFIDADKASTADYFDRAVQLSRPGALVMVDNVVREGAVIDAASDDPSVIGIRKFNELVAADPRVSVTTIQTVGAKGYDGFALALVIG
ncbi:MAG: O-methyltransferase [Gemmatimonadaceae bacterium]